MILLRIPAGILQLIFMVLGTLYISLDILFCIHVLRLPERLILARSRQLIWGYCRVCVYGGFNQIKFQGLEHIDPHTSYIVMMNHTSFLDIPVSMLVFSKKKKHLRFLTKKEMHRIPIWGKALKDTGFVAIDRKNREAAIASLQRVKEALRKGLTFWISPEGTRGPGGNKLLPFKKGGFITAIESQAPILPMVLIGAEKVMPKGSFLLRGFHKLEVRIGEPIDTTQYTLEDKEALMARVRTWMLAELDIQEDEAEADAPAA